MLRSSEHSLFSFLNLSLRDKGLFPGRGPHEDAPVTFQPPSSHLRINVRQGVEKVAVSAAAIEDNYLIRAAAERIGSQSLVVVIDVKKTGILHRYEVVTHNGSRRTGLDPIDFAIRVAEAGVGEILVQSVDRDGEMKGYDFDLVDSIRRVIKVPITVLGGAGSLDDIERLIKRYGIVGAAAGSIFVFKGKYRAVLINYPDRGEKERLCQRAGFSVE